MIKELQNKLRASRFEALINSLKNILLFIPIYKYALTILYNIQLYSDLVLYLCIFINLYK